MISFQMLSRYQVQFGPEDGFLAFWGQALAFPGSSAMHVFTLEKSYAGTPKLDGGPVLLVVRSISAPMLSSLRIPMVIEIGIRSWYIMGDSLAICMMPQL